MASLRLGQPKPKRRRDPADALQDIEAEQTILAKLLSRVAKVNDRAAALSVLLGYPGFVPTVFTRRAHRLIYEEIIKASEDGNPPDWVIVRKRLQDQGADVFDEVGEGFIEELSEREHHAIILPGHVEGLVDLAIRRRVSEETKGILDSVSNQPVDAEVLARFASTFVAIVHEFELSSARPQRTKLGSLWEQFPDLRPPVIDGWLRKGETGNLIADSKAGKSWLTYHIALSFISRRQIFERFHTAGGKVLLIDNELHPETLSRRLQIVAKEMGVDPKIASDSIDVLPLRGNLRSLAELTNELRSVPRGEYVLIILDAKYRFVSSDSDERDNSAETRFYNQVDQLASITDAAILLVHHTSKGLQSEKRLTDVGSGAGAQSRAADCHLVLREHTEAGVYVLEAAVRSFPPVEQVCVRFRHPVWEIATDLDPAQLKRRRPASAFQQEERDRETAAKILEKCECWASSKDIRKATGFGEPRVDRGISMLLASGRLEKAQEKRRGQECDVYRTRGEPHSACRDSAQCSE